MKSDFLRPKRNELFFEMEILCLVPRTSAGLQTAKVPPGVNRRGTVRQGWFGNVRLWLVIQSVHQLGIEATFGTELAIAS